MPGMRCGTGYLYELHDLTGEFASVPFAQKHVPAASELLLGGSIFPGKQNFLLAARTLRLGACMSWSDGNLIR
jgi:hypothetical protein